jgi:hypothetical protein
METDSQAGWRMPSWEVWLLILGGTGFTAFNLWRGVPWFTAAGIVLLVTGLLNWWFPRWSRWGFVTLAVVLLGSMTNEIVGKGVTTLRVFTLVLNVGFLVWILAWALQKPETKSEAESGPDQEEPEPEPVPGQERTPLTRRVDR